MEPALDDRQLLAAHPSVPEHVVARDFGDESVALNLRSGQYHGLNGVAARMFEALKEAPTVGDAAMTLAAEFGQPRDVIERDLAAFVRGLHERGLLELDGAGDR